MESPARGYRQLASVLREQIVSGELQPGQRVPTEQELMHEHGVARETARRALAVLRHEGLLDVRHGHPTRVRVQPERVPVAIQRGSRLFVRMPTPQEREDLDVADGVPVLAVEYGTRRRVYPGDRHVFTTA